MTRNRCSKMKAVFHCCSHQLFRLKSTSTVAYLLVLLLPSIFQFKGSCSMFWGIVAHAERRAFRERSFFCQHFDLGSVSCFPIMLTRWSTPASYEEAKFIKEKSIKGRSLSAKRVAVGLFDFLYYILYILE